ncbi:MAG: ribonuclease HII [candidate division Zixibacteria bacterium]|nr:ribonuclease HII [candidate division Zixibacteria bacterium]
MVSPQPISVDRWRHERHFWDSGLSRVAGLDEVGRGPLAGPVVAVAIILQPDCDDPGIADSKSLTAAQRLALVPHICSVAAGWGVGLVEPADIDQINILNATFLAMRRALLDLPVMPEGVLVDGKFHIPEVDLPQRAIIGGDRDSISVGAASILAKEIRDRIMEEYDLQYPGYGFAHHKGYATPEHQAALARLGPTPIHRQSFAPVRDWRQSSLGLS